MIYIVNIYIGIGISAWITQLQRYFFHSLIRLFWPALVQIQHVRVMWCDGPSFCVNVFFVEESLVKEAEERNIFDLRLKC